MLKPELQADGHLDASVALANVAGDDGLANVAVGPGGRSGPADRSPVRAGIMVSTGHSLALPSGSILDLDHLTPNLD